MEENVNAFYGWESRKGRMDQKVRSLRMSSMGMETELRLRERWDYWRFYTVGCGVKFCFKTKTKTERKKEKNKRKKK